MNFYSVARDAAILQGSVINADQFPLLVTLAMRWPVLMEHLERFPQAIQVVHGEEEYSPERHGELDRDVYTLLHSDAVADVVIGRSLDPPVPPVDRRALAAWTGIGDVHRRAGDGCEAA